MPSELTAVRLSLGLREPHVAAHGPERHRDVVLIRCRSEDGSVGWGECPTLSGAGYSEETTDRAWESLVAGGSTRLGPMAAGALADAQLDAGLRGRGRSLASLLGATRSSVPMTLVVSMGRVLDDELVGSVSMVKMKIDPSSVGRLREIRDRYPDVALAADANGSFRSGDEVPGWIDELDLAYLEQPVPPGDLGQLVELRHRLRTPIALDESISGPESLGEALSVGALDVVSIKPARVGGLMAARDCLVMARAGGVDAFVGGMLETGIGRAGALTLAACDGITLPTDLGPSRRYFDRDVCDPIVVGPDGQLVVPVGPGIGRIPDADALDRFVVDEAPVSVRA